MIVIILMQASKGGGLSGAFGTGAGSSPLFGAATSSVLVRTTTVLAVIFAVTCISLAAIQAKRSSFVKGEGKEDKGKVSTMATEKKEGLAAPEGEAVEGKEGEGAPSPVEEKVLSPVEAGPEGEKEGAPEGVKPSPPEEKPLSPVEAGAAGKEDGAVKSEKPLPPEEKALSPVEAGRAEE